MNRLVLSEQQLWQGMWKFLGSFIQEGRRSDWKVWFSKNLIDQRFERSESKGDYLVSIRQSSIYPLFLSALFEQKEKAKKGKVYSPVLLGKKPSFREEKTKHTRFHLESLSVTVFFLLYSMPVTVEKKSSKVLHPFSSQFRSLFSYPDRRVCPRSVVVVIDK